MLDSPVWLTCKVAGSNSASSQFNSLFKSPLPTMEDTIQGNQSADIAITLKTMSTAGVFNIAIGVIGIFCNLLSITIVLKFSVAKIMRINLFMLNQATIDLISCFWLIIFGLSLEVSSYDGVLGAMMCRFWSPGSNFPLFTCFAISSFNLAAMAIERYTAVLYPIKYKKVYNKRNTALMILLVWIIGPLGQYIFPAFKKSSTDDGLCVVQSTWTPVVGSVSGVFLFFWEFLIPCIIMIWAYIEIVKELRKQDNKVHDIAAAAAELHAPNRVVRPVIRRHNRKSMTLTVFTLFIVYIICWTPNQITFLQFNLGGPLYFDGGWYHFTVFIAFCNSFSNAIVYMLWNNQFQLGVKDLCLCRQFKTKNVKPITVSVVMCDKPGKP